MLLQAPYLFGNRSEDTYRQALSGPFMVELFTSWYFSKYPVVYHYPGKIRRRILAPHVGIG